MTTPADINDDLERVLALAKVALTARDDAASWSRSPERQIGHHGACCDALWDELERLVQINEGKVPTLEHPAARERRIAKRIRGNIITAILNTAEETLTQFESGAYWWEEPGSYDIGSVE